LEDVGIILADVTPAQHTLLSGQADVLAVPPLDNAIPNDTVRDMIRNFLENQNLPALWVNTGMTYRTVLRVTLGVFQFHDRFVSSLQRRLWDGSINLNTTIGSLSQPIRDLLQNVANSFNLDMSGISGSTTIREMLRSIGQQFATRTFTISGVGLSMDIWSMPRSQFTDDFTDTNGVNLTTHNASWVKHGTGDMLIDTNAFYPSTVATHHMYSWNASVTDNQFAQVTLATPGAGTSSYRGPAVRCKTDATMNGYYFFASQNSQSFCGKQVANTPTDFSSSLGAMPTGTIIRIEIVGTVISVYKDAVNIASFVDSTHSSGHVGIAGYENQTSRGDDWKGGGISALDSHAKLRPKAFRPGLARWEFELPATSL
jgi:hypothetical protein